MEPTNATTTNVNLSGSRRLPRIDIHTHILPPDIPDFKEKFGYGEWTSMTKECGCKARMYKGGKFFREVEPNCYDEDSRIADCDRDGVTVQVRLLLFGLVNIALYRCCPPFQSCFHTMLNQQTDSRWLAF